jgi:23S rRNA (cytosine1962-C5)-methyltransferase
MSDQIFFQQLANKPLVLEMSRDISKHIKRGHPWVFSDVIRLKPKAPEGVLAILKDRNDENLALGIYSPTSNMTLRILKLFSTKLTALDISDKIDQAIKLRAPFFAALKKTNSFRLIHGEGDGLPGLIVDIYNTTAVIKLDGAMAQAFWHPPGIAQYLKSKIALSQAYLKFRSEEAKSKNKKGEFLFGNEEKEITILENNQKFLVDIVDGSKTGFFLDQRDHRQLVAYYAKNKTVLNIFGYTGGFSIYAGTGGASKVSTVDISPQAIAVSEKNWTLNGLDKNLHEPIAEDAFVFCENAKKDKRQWDLVIVDPPSFIPSEKTMTQGREAYLRIFKMATALVKDNGMIAFASCSAHLSVEDFNEICQEALSSQKKRAASVRFSGQPADHPYPFGAPEMRYLKFSLLQLTN